MQDLAYSLASSASTDLCCAFTMRCFPKAGIHLASFLITWWEGLEGEPGARKESGLCWGIRSESVWANMKGLVMTSGNGWHAGGRR